MPSIRLRGGATGLADLAVCDDSGAAELRPICGMTYPDIHSVRFLQD